MIQFDLDVPAT